MGDMSEYRGLIVIGTTISIAVMLMALIPAEFYPYYSSTRQIITPDYFELIDLTNYVDTWSNNIDNGTLVYQVWVQEIDDGDGDFGGWEFSLASNGDTQILTITQFQWIFIFRTPLHYASFHSNTSVNLGTQLLGEELLAYGTEYKVKTPDTSFDLIFSYNTTIYTDTVDAWESDELYLLCGIHFDQAQTTYNAWDIIAQVLFFQMPNVHWFINAVLAIPIWLGVAYIAFILALRAIGAVFGGGA